MKRRRFLQIAAAASLAGLPARGETVFPSAPDWVGRGLGADLALHLDGPGDRAAVLAALPRLIAGIEEEFSLYDPASALSRLNATGTLHPSRTFRALMAWAEVIWQATDGAFDPTVQALWLARQNGVAPGPVGFDRIEGRGTDRLRLRPGMTLTFNGIAQGYAADAVRGMLARHGFVHALIDMGEQAALGGPWRIGIADPVVGILAERQLVAGALATSSPLATLVAGQPHLMHPRGLPPLWSTVSVEAETATLADGLSTAAVFFDPKGLTALLSRLSGLRRIVAVDFDGNLSTFQA